MGDEERLAAIRARCEAATPGPWRWKGNRDSQSIYLFRARAWGDVVMAFFRWGMQSAQPRFVTDGLIVKPKWEMGPDHHPWEIVGIDHPDAKFIEHSREDVDWLLASRDALTARVAALEAALGALMAGDGGEGEAMGDERAAIERAHAMVAALCTPKGQPGWRDWLMSIPARPDHDPDLVIAAGLNAGERAIARADALAWRVAVLEAALVESRAESIAADYWGEPQAIEYFRTVARDDLRAEGLLAGDGGEGEAMGDERAAIERAHAMVAALCTPKGQPGWRDWLMSIPARPDHDPDLVIAAGLNAGERAIARADALAWRVAVLEAALVESRAESIAADYWGEPQAIEYFRTVARDDLRAEGLLAGDGGEG